MLKTVEINPGLGSIIDASGGYCPCTVIWDEDHKCPCKEFREQTVPGPCHCGRYAKEEEESE